MAILPKARRDTTRDFSFPCSSVALFFLLLVLNSGRNSSAASAFLPPINQGGIFPKTGSTTAPPHPEYHRGSSILFAAAPPRRRSRRKDQPRGRQQQRRRYNDYDEDDNFVVMQEFDDYDDEFDFGDDDYDDEEPPTFDIDSGNNNNNNVGEHFFSRKPLEDPSFVFEDNPTSEDIFDRLCQGAGITRPSRIQSFAWPVVLSGKHAIIADQTGSGKTLAYLVPLLQRALSKVKRDPKQKQPLHNPPKLNGAPKILVLAPTAELADQVRAVCDRLSQHMSFSTMVVTATGKYSTSIRDQIRMLQRQPVDVLISTPGRLSTIVRTRNSGLDLSSRIQALVLDEVDILMDDNSNTNNNNNLMHNNPGGSMEQDENDTFGPQLRTIGQAVGEQRLQKTQFVFVTATLPDRIVKTVTNEFPGVVQVRGPGLHRVAPSMTERLIDVSVPSRDNRNSKLGLQVKAKQLLKTLRMTRCRRTLIFCNTVQSCRAVENLLRRSDRKRQRYDVRAYHNAMTPETRVANLEIFSNAGQQKQQGGNNKHNNNNNNKHRPWKDLDYVLVCTDRAGRGVDFGASPVDHVVLFDFPRDPAEYVRRVGRTARAGRAGTCTVFAYGWQLPIARSVMGKTLETLRVAAGEDSNDEDDDDDDGFIRGGVQGRRRHKGKQQKGKPSESRTRDTAVKNNIEGGRLWKG